MGVGVGDIVGCGAECRSLSVPDELQLRCYDRSEFRSTPRRSLASPHLSGKLTASQRVPDRPPGG